MGRESVPLIRWCEMCCRDWGRRILPESRSDRSGEHDCFRRNQVMSDAVIGIFDGKSQVMIDSFLREGLDSPIRRVNKGDLLEQWVGFLNCF